MDKLAFVLGRHCKRAETAQRPWDWRTTGNMLGWMATLGLGGTKNPFIQRELRRDAFPVSNQKPQPRAIGGAGQLAAIRGQSLSEDAIRRGRGDVARQVNEFYR